MRDLIANALLDNSEEAFCVLDVQGRFAHANVHAERLLRRSREEILGRRAWDEFPETVGETIQRAHRRAFEEHEPLACEIYYPPLDTWFEMRAYPSGDFLVVHFRDITRRKNAQSALRESEERYRTIVGTVIEAVLTMDEQDTIRFANPAVKRVFGYAPEELLGQPMDLLIPERLREAHRAGVARYSATGERRIPWDGVEFPGLHKSGREILLEISFAEDELDGRRMFTGIVRDITERKRVEAALRESEERFQLVAQATGDVLWDHDFHADRLWWSEHFSHLFGYAPEQVGSTFASWEERVHPEDRARVSALIEEALWARRPTASAEYRLRRADGAYLHVLDRMHLLYDEEGNPRRAVGALIDITEQKAAEARQRFLYEAGLVLTSTLDYEQRLRDLARVCAGYLADCCVVDMVESDGRVRRVEAAAADPEKEGPVRELLRFPPAHAAEEGVAKALKTGEPIHVKRVTEKALQRMAQNAEHLDALRSLAPDNYLVVPLRVRGKTLGSFKLINTTPGRHFAPADVALAKDLARQAALDLSNAHLHRDMERARHAAEEASHAKGQFLAIMSHELRTPLTAIVAFADLIESGVSGPVTAKQKEHAARIQAGAWHLVAMIDEVLTYSRMEAGAEQAHLGPVDGGEVARAVVHLLAPKAELKGLALRDHVPEHPVGIETDAGRLRQILMNLLGNAIKFTEHGEVTFELEQSEEWIEFRVRDTGEGIAPEDRERIFEPFVQAEEAHTRRHDGTGLGLAISRRFARMLGGDIEVESALGQGSTFTLRLPTPASS